MGSFLKLGQVSAAVKELQIALNKRGASLIADGVFGAQTNLAVISFQLSNSLEADGIVGHQTMEKLGLLPSSTPPRSDGPNPFKRASVPWYEWFYQHIAFDKGTEHQVLNAAKSLLKGKARYLPLEQELGVPWTTIAALHKMEGDSNFETYLGNGQSIHRVTTIVPRGRGPFSSFEAGARDALKLDGLTQVKNWSLGLELKYGEQFNGLGYMQYHPSEMSPYIWACSNINDGTGKYVSDGHYDANANANAQVGVATMFKQLELLGEYKPVFSTAG